MATNELEALVGHLFVFGGRSISSAAPGAIATPPPRKAARGRDAETLFALVALPEDVRQPASFYEEMTGILSDAYFGTAGSVTSAMRDAVTAVNDHALGINRRDETKFEVGLACIVLRGMEVFIAVTGPARCYLMRDGFAERLPSNDDLAEGALGLGLYEDFDVRFYRREIRDNDFLIIADSTLNRLADDTLRHAVSTGEVDVTLNNLAGVAGDYTAAQVIKFVSPLAEGEQDTLASPDRAEPVAGRGAPRTAPPPAHATEVDEGAMLTADDPEEPAEKEPSLIQKAVSGAAFGLSKMLGGVRSVMGRRIERDEDDNLFEDALNLPPAAQIAIAVAVAGLVALTTSAVYRVRGATSQYDQLVRQAQAEIEMAQAGADQAEARPHYETALFLLDQAGDLRDHSDTVNALRQQSIEALDAYDSVTRVSPVLLRTYQPGAFLRGPVINGLNLYVIDTTNDILYREDLDETGQVLVNRESQIIARQGEQINNQVVGGLIDLAWMEDGGVPTRNVLATLSRNGLLITYSPSWDVTTTLLPGFEAWGDPRAIAIYDRDLYVLDAGANEIWRYEAGTDAYSNTPQRYFTDVVPDLSDAVDMQIDSNGNIYVLHASGQLSKYFFGRPETFDFQGLPQPLVRPTGMHLNVSLFDRALFIADAGGSRLYSTSLNGIFLANYKDGENTQFEAISGVYSLDDPAFVYVTTGNQLVYFSRP